jgi:hypothetical protein
MVYTTAEFTSILQFTALAIYQGFYMLMDAKVFNLTGVGDVSLFDLLFGFLVVSLIVDRILAYTEE